MALTPKQEGFCFSYMETGNASEAYRRHYAVSNMKMESVNREAKTLIDSPKISSRIEELRQVAAKKHDITVADLIAELEEARQAALRAETPQASAAATATMGKAKMLGFLVEKNEHTGVLEIKIVERRIVDPKSTSVK